MAQRSKRDCRGVGRSTLDDSTAILRRGLDSSTVRCLLRSHAPSRSLVGGSRRHAATGLRPSARGGQGQAPRARCLHRAVPSLPRAGAEGAAAPRGRPGSGERTVGALDAERGAGVEVSHRFGVTTYPTVLVLTPDGIAVEEILAREPRAFAAELGAAKALASALLVHVRTYPSSLSSRRCLWALVAWKGPPPIDPSQVRAAASALCPGLVVAKDSAALREYRADVCPKAGARHLVPGQTPCTGPDTLYRARHLVPGQTPCTGPDTLYRARLAIEWSRNSQRSIRKQTDCEMEGL